MSAVFSICNPAPRRRCCTGLKCWIRRSIDEWGFVMDAVSTQLLAAQNKAEALFAEVVDRGLVSAGKLESERTQEIHALALSRFGVRRHWHKRIARAGPNTLLTYYDESADRRIEDDDIVYLDFGPVF